MEIKVLMFGVLSDITDTSEVTVNLESQMTIINFNSLLKEKYQVLGQYTYSIAVNEAYQQTNFMLNDGDTVALIPPVSGG